MTLTDYMYQEKEEEDASILQLKEYLENRGETLIKATRNNIDNMRTNIMTTTRKQKWEEKQLYGRFERLISNISAEKKNMNVAKKGKY